MRVALWCVVAALPLLLARASVIGLTDPSEARYGQICREMAESGDWLVPTWLAVPHLEKPPLAYWAGALGIRLFGRSELPARLVALLAFLATAIWTAGIARRVAGREAEAPAALAMLLTPFPVLAGVACMTDPFLLATATLFHHSVVRRLRDGSRSAMDVAALALALGILAKGHMILLFTAVPLALAWTGVFAELLRPRRLLLLAATVPWFAAVEHRCPGFLREQALAFAGRAAGRGHDAPVFVYVVMLAAGLFPFVLSAPRALSLLFPPAPSLLGRFRSAPPENRLLLLWLVVPLVVFTAVGSRLWTYILPAVPPVAVFAGARLRGRGASTASALPWVIAAAGVVVLLARLAGVRAGEPFLAHGGVVLLVIGAWLLVGRRLPRFVATAGVSALVVAGILHAAYLHEGRFQTHRGFATAVAELSRSSGAPVVLAGTLLPSVGFYCDAPVRIAGETSSVLAREARLWGPSPQFTPDTDLRELLGKDFESVIVVEEKLLRALAPDRIPVLREGGIVAVVGGKAGTGGPVR